MKNPVIGGFRNLKPFSGRLLFPQITGFCMLFFLQIQGANIFAGSFLNNAQSNVFIQIINNNNAGEISQNLHNIPQSPQKVFLESYHFTLDALINDNAESFRKLEGKTSEYIKIIESSRKEIPHLEHLLISRIYLNIAFVHIHFGNNVKGILAYRQANQYLKKQLSNYPEKEESKGIQAVIEIFSGSIPDSYKTLAGLAGFSGNTETGFKLLNGYLKYSRQSDYLHHEALLWNSFVGSRYNSFLPDFNFADIERIKQSNILSFFYGFSLLKQRKPLETLEIVKNNNFPLTYYLRGISNLTLLNIDEAKNELSTFLKFHKGSCYHNDAARKLYWIAFFNDNNEGVEFWKNKAAVSAVPQTTVDKEAINECSRNELPHKELLKSRLLFDGGNYAQALETVRSANIPNSNKNWIVEKEYRTGRIFLTMGQTDNAIKPFENCVNNYSSDIKSYYPAYSALELATIYHNKKMFDERDKWIKKCNKLNTGDYQLEIKEKLSKLKNI